MQKLYPSLCNTLDFSRLKSEICELTKNQRVSYLISGKKKVKFFLSYTYISVARWFLSLINDFSRLLGSIY